MNDRFKFRVWNNAAKIFVDRFTLSPDDAICIISDKGKAYVKGNPNYILMQCTGLKDKNGKLIYEGDIVKVACMHEKMGGLYYMSMQVIYEVIEHGNDAYSGFSLKHNEKGVFALWGKDKLEVIGNIYENKELLNE